MLAPDTFPKGVVEADFLAALRESATGLPLSPRIAKWGLDRLAERCARDLGLDTECIQYLLAKGRVPHQFEPIRRMKKDWRPRIRALPERIPGKPRIAVILCEGQAVRSFLVSDVCKKLATWAELCILSCYDVESDVRNLGSHVHFFPVPAVRRTRLDMMVSYLGFMHTDSHTNKRMIERLNENLQKAIDEDAEIDGSIRIWQIATELPSIADYLKAYSWSLRFYARACSLKETTRLLQALNADIVFNTSSVSWTSRLWTRSAALADIPVVANVISWDNMSTKTLLDEFADTFLIWSDEMEEDFSTTLPFLRHKPRVIVGSPQFEPILQRRGLLPRSEFFRQHGLDPAKKLILYTTGSTTIFPREQECLDTVLGHWRDNLRDHTNIMVRMHPKDRQGRYEHVLQRFPEVPFTLAGHRLAHENEWVPTREDIDLLVNQLHHCDVIVNVASTMTLEGFTIDKPAINIGFSLGSSLSSRYPMDDYYKSRHYCDVVGSGAARLVNNYKELFEALDDVLDRQVFDVEKQRRILLRKCKYIDDSSDRIDAFMREYVARKAKARA